MPQYQRKRPLAWHPLAKTARPIVKTMCDERNENCERPAWAKEKKCGAARGRGSGLAGTVSSSQTEQRQPRFTNRNRSNLRIMGEPEWRSLIDRGTCFMSAPWNLSRLTGRYETRQNISLNT